MKTALELARAIEACMATLDDDDLDACAWISEVLQQAEPIKPGRIAITVNGGEAEIVDAENWPDGLELFIVDYDCDGAEPDELCHVEGSCTISKVDGIGEMTGHFASKVAEAWKYD